MIVQDLEVVVLVPIRKLAMDIIRMTLGREYQLLDIHPKSLPDHQLLSEFAGDYQICLVCFGYIVGQYQDQVGEAFRRAGGQSFRDGIRISYIVGDKRTYGYVGKNSGTPQRSEDHGYG